MSLGPLVDTVKSTVNTVKSSLSGNSEVVSMTPYVVNADPVIVFPSDLRDPKYDWPFMVFSLPAENTDIYLPIPQGLTFSDSMSYSSINLGIIGSIGSETINAIAKQDTISGAIGAGVGGLAGSVINKAKKVNAAAAASILARNVLRQEQIADVIDFSTRQVLAPNTNTSFQSTNVRSFAFNFKLVSKNKGEAKTIKKIDTVFRHYMYPEGNDVILKYPPMWKIRFYNKGQEESQFIPKIYPCYLIGMSSTINSSTNIYHEDGSPVETDIQLSFQEIKALTRKHIDDLESGKTNK